MDVLIVLKKYSGILEKMNELEGEKSDIVSKLEEANIKIQDLQAIIDQKEKIEEDFQQKEEQYNKTINELSENLKNIQSKDIIKIITSDQSIGPNKEWEEYAKTTHAKRRIREFNKKDI